MPTAILGVISHWLGGLASGSFHVPHKGVRKWTWETYGLVGGVFSWIVCPLLLASILTKDAFGVGATSISQTSSAVTVSGLRCEYLTNPPGIDSPKLHIPDVGGPPAYLRKTLVRTPKDSAHWYREVISTNGARI